MRCDELFLLSRLVGGREKTEGSKEGVRAAGAIECRDWF